uniref:hypothetical protein n=1 Tax=Agathobacter sp. TaxID=2021311 RepID=UPI004056DAB8
MPLCKWIICLYKSLPGYKKKKGYGCCKEVFFCTRQKASYTLEAAVLFPLATGFLVSMLFFFQILQIQRDVEEAFLYAGKKTALESSMVSSETALALSAKSFFLYGLEQCGVPEEHIAGGKLGISLYGSDFSEEEITLQASYYIKLPIAFFGKKYFFVTHENTFQKWIGDVERTGEELSEGSYVYITPNGSAYHKTTGCRSLELSVQRILLEKIEELRGADGQKYYACSICKSDKAAAYVYYTKYGYLYHADTGCPAIKRTVLRIAFSEITTHAPCKYCWE